MDVKKNSIVLLGIKNYDGSLISLDGFIKAEVELIAYDYLEKYNKVLSKKQISDMTGKMFQAYLEKEVI